MLSRRWLYRCRMSKRLKMSQVRSHGITRDTTLHLPTATSSLKLHLETVTLNVLDPFLNVQLAWGRSVMTTPKSRNSLPLAEELLAPSEKGRRLSDLLELWRVHKSERALFKVVTLSSASGPYIGVANVNWTTQSNMEKGHIWYLTYSLNRLHKVTVLQSRSSLAVRAHASFSGKDIVNINVPKVPVVG